MKSEVHRKHPKLKHKATLISFVVAMLNSMLNRLEYLIRNSPNLQVCLNGLTLPIITSSIALEGVSVGYQEASSAEGKNNTV